jgi:uncharacterized protein YdeI (YjbR/CyaY-like superfamily)
MNQELREKIGMRAGEVMTIQVGVDHEPKPFDIPQDFAAELMKNAKASAYFEQASPLHRKAYLNWIGSAIQPESRKRKILKAVKMLADDNSV